MVRPTGIEPVAYSLGGYRSIQLSYERQYINMVELFFPNAFDAHKKLSTG